MSYFPKFRESKYGRYLVPKNEVGLFAAIFYFLKKKVKGFPLQSLTQNPNSRELICKYKVKF